MEGYFCTSHFNKLVNFKRRSSREKETFIDSSNTKNQRTYRKKQLCFLIFVRVI